MTAAGWGWMGVAALLAVLDWAVVAARSGLLERCAKPAVLLALLAAALTARPGHAGVHGWLLLALGFGLIGDVALSFASPGQPAGPPPAAQPPPSGLDALNFALSEEASLAQPPEPDAEQPADSAVGVAARRPGGAHRADRAGRPTGLAER